MIKIEKHDASLDVFVSDTSIARNLHLPGEITLKLPKDPYSFLCTLDQMSVFAQKEGTCEDQDLIIIELYYHLH